MTPFERQLAGELQRRAGPVGPVDDAAILAAVVAATTSPRWRFQPLFSALKLVLAGAIVALSGGFLLVGVSTEPVDEELVPAAASPAPTATHHMLESPEMLEGLVTEEVEPGVLRIIRDDAGHDLDERHPDFRYDMDGIAIGPEGSVWLTSTHHDSDNEANPVGPLVWSLGRPGTFGIAEGLPSRGWPVVIPLADGLPLIISDRIVRFDGQRFVPDDGHVARRLARGTLWILEPRDLMGLVDDGAFVQRPDERLALIFDGGWRSVHDLGRTARVADMECTATPSGVECWGFGVAARSYLEGTQINAVASAPDGSLWAVGGYQGAGGGLYRISFE